MMETVRTPYVKISTTHQRWQAKKILDLTNLQFPPEFCFKAIVDDNQILVYTHGYWLCSQYSLFLLEEIVFVMFEGEKCLAQTVPIVIFWGVIFSSDFVWIL